MRCAWAMLVSQLLVRVYRIPFRHKALKHLSWESLPWFMVKIHTLNKLKLLNYKLQRWRHISNRQYPRKERSLWVGMLKNQYLISCMPENTLRFFGGQIGGDRLFFKDNKLFILVDHYFTEIDISCSSLDLNQSAWVSQSIMQIDLMPVKVEGNSWAVGEMNKLSAQNLGIVAEMSLHHLIWFVLGQSQDTQYQQCQISLRKECPKPIMSGWR